jgi:hypothetical protein
MALERPGASAVAVAVAALPRPGPARQHPPRRLRVADRHLACPGGASCCVLLQPRGTRGARAAAAWQAAAWLDWLDRGSVDRGGRLLRVCAVRSSSSGGQPAASSQQQQHAAMGRLPREWWVPRSSVTPSLYVTDTVCVGHMYPAIALP